MQPDIKLSLSDYEIFQIKHIVPDVIKDGNNPHCIHHEIDSDPLPGGGVIGVCNKCGRVKKYINYKEPVISHTSGWLSQVLA